MIRFCTLLGLGALTTVYAATHAPVTVREGHLEGHPEWRFVDMAVDLKKAHLQVVIHPGGDMMSKLVPEGAWVVINGGYFDGYFKPTGWLKDSAKEYAKKVSRKTGGVLAVKDGEAYIGTLSSIHFQPEFALQNGPLLVEPNGKIGIRKDDGRRAARTVACVVDGKSEEGVVKGKLHWVLILTQPHEGPTLMETAQFLKTPLAEKGFGCTAALNLDGGPSTGVWLTPKLGVRAAPAPVPIGYAIATVPKLHRNPNSKTNTKRK